jgi:hypothetical protein
MPPSEALDLQAALRVVQALGVGPELSVRIASLETELAGATARQVLRLLAGHGVDDVALRGALTIKEMSGQIDVVVHAVGILVSLPYILAPGEKVESLSLGAGNTGRDHDLVTNRQIAEFKFITWRGGPESIRQNALFADIFSLASSPEAKRRVMYVVGKEHPMRFLHGGRSLPSVLSKNRAVEERFRQRHGTKFAVVRDYWATVADLVEIVDLRDVVPGFAAE